MTVFTFIIVSLGCMIAYLAGSIPFGLLLGKAFGVGDIRKIGSGNIGATNMLRTGKKGLAALTLILDFAKAIIAIGFAEGFCSYFFNHVSGDTVSPLAIDCLAGVAVVLGHVFPIWLDFKGGKGVATTFGVFFAIQPFFGMLALLGWAMIFYLTRISSLAAIGSIASIPILAFRYTDWPFSAMALVLAVIVLWRHKDNIARLRHGSEDKWEKKDDAA